MHWIIERHSVVGSTMDAAEERARRGAPAGVVVVAGEQTEGRGQRGRRWLAPAESSLLLTIVARPEITPDKLAELPELVGQYLARALENAADLACELKRPNDVLVNGRKLAGVLCQSCIEGQLVRYVLIGIGVNVNISRENLPLPTATSLQIETGRIWDLYDLLDRVLNELERCWCFTPCMKA